MFSPLLHEGSFVSLLAPVAHPIAGALVHSTVGHQDLVTSLDFSPTGLHLVSSGGCATLVFVVPSVLFAAAAAPVNSPFRDCLATLHMYILDSTRHAHHLVSNAAPGHDRSVRIWDIAGRRCVSEFTAHRRKFDEAIHSVRFHSSLPFLARYAFACVGV
jgi:WD40 repeat protein